ncbi:hypothetical protein FB107DRAFT_286776 [Schizophyllum commune]
MHEKDSKSMVLLRSGTLAASETRRTPAEATLDDADLRPCFRKKVGGLCLWSAKVVVSEWEDVASEWWTLRCNEDDQNNGGTIAAIRGVDASS